MSLELNKDILVTKVMNAVAAGTTAQNTSVIDMAGYDAVCFIADFGTIVDASVVTLTTYENTANSTSGGTAVTNGASATITASTSSNITLAVDVIRPTKRYVFATITRTTQNATISSVYALQYRARVKPVTQTAASFVASSPEV